MNTFETLKVKPINKEKFSLAASEAQNRPLELRDNLALMYVGQRVALVEPDAFAQIGKEFQVQVFNKKAPEEAIELFPAIIFSLTPEFLTTFTDSEIPLKEFHKPFGARVRNNLKELINWSNEE